MDKRLPDAYSVDSTRTYRIVRGVVQIYFKDIGLYLITYLEESLASSGLVPAVDLSGTSPSGNSTITDSNVLVPGTGVFVLKPSILSWKQDSRPSTYAIILGADNVFGKPNIFNHPQWTMSARQKTSEMDYLLGVSDAARKAIKEICSISRLGDHAGGPPLDLCSGDWITYNPLKGYIASTNERVTISGNHMNGLHFFTGSDTCIFNTGTKFLQESYPYRKTIYPDGDGFTQVDSYAATAAEALGSFGEVDEAISKDKPYTISNNEIIPIWRHQNIQGKLIQGRIESLNTPEEDSGVNTSDKEATQRTVISDYKGYDGTRASSAAHSASISRDPALVTITQLNDEFAQEEPLFNEDEPSTDAFTSLEGDIAENATQYAGLMYELMKHKFVERYLGKLKGRKDSWAVLTAEEICDKIFNENQPDTPLQNLDDNDPCYKTSTEIKETTDPITKGTLKTTLAPNYVHLDPSGAVIISDGHGSEIRMEGGNITISCPGDLKLLPGRDLVTLVPRDLSLVAQRHLDIASDKNEVTVKGEKGVGIAAVKGALSLEGRDTTPSSAETEDDRIAGNTSGVIIRSASTVAMVGQNVRVGIQKAGDTQTGGRADGSGTVVIDAGKGTTMVTGGTTYVSGDQYVGMTTKSGMVSVAGGAVGLGGSTIDLAASRVGIGGSNIETSHPEMTEGGLESSDIKSKGSSQAVLSVNGTIFASKNIGANYVIASYVRAKTVGANNGSKMSGVRATGSVSPIWKEGGKGIDSSSASAYKNASKGGIQSCKDIIESDKLFSAAGTVAPGLYYPKSQDYGCGDNYFLVPSRWQRKLKEGGGGYNWKFNPVEYPLTKKDGLPKPGLEALTENNIIKDASVNKGEIQVNDRGFEDGYTVNARSE